MGWWAVANKGLCRLVIYCNRQNESNFKNINFIISNFHSKTVVLNFFNFKLKILFEATKCVLSKLNNYFCPFMHVLWLDRISISSWWPFLVFQFQIKDLIQNYKMCVTKIKWQLYLFIHVLWLMRIFNFKLTTLFNFSILSWRPYSKVQTTCYEN